MKHSFETNKGNEYYAPNNHKDNSNSINNASENSSDISMSQ